MTPGSERAFTGGRGGAGYGAWKVQKRYDEEFKHISCCLCWLYMNRAMDDHSSGCLPAEKFPTFASGRQGRGLESTPIGEAGPRPFWLSFHLTLKLNLVVDWDRVLAYDRNRRFCATRLVNRPRTDGRNSKASALIKPKALRLSFVVVTRSRATPSARSLAISASIRAVPIPLLGVSASKVISSRSVSFSAPRAARR